MTSLTLTATFSTHVRIGTGAAGRSLDEVIDREMPLSNGSIKGVLREESRWLLPGTGDSDHPFVEAVFGDRRIECPWNFNFAPMTAVPDNAYSTRASIRLDPKGQIDNGALAVKEEAAIPRATVTITARYARSSRGLPDNLKAAADDCHLALIHLAGRAVEKVGQRRARGLGWVSLASDRDVARDLELIWQIREAERE